MSNQQVIRAADLGIINRALTEISRNMDGVHSELGSLNYKQDALESELLRLASSFADFVEADVQHKAMQLAETRVGNLKQELEIKYGYYAEVRRMATGILQAVDTGTVSKEALKNSTEETMIKAPGYWLAPVLVALSAWIRNDKDVCNKALVEAVKRDDYKSTLFFMLVMRRLSRNDASLKWVERYFLHQNPKNLDREFIIVLEGITTGLFHPASKSLMMNNVKAWLDQLSQSENFVEEQKEQWTKYFEASKPTAEGLFPLIGQFSTNWIDLDRSIRECKTHDYLYEHFNNIISNTKISKSTNVQLDEILSLLVTNFDDEELPLQEQVRLQELIIEKQGDKRAAQEIVEIERFVFEEEVDFLQLLTNACFNPDLAGATSATQALAVSISQPWIVEAHDSFTAKIRNTVPSTFNLEIDGFKGNTKNGQNEKDLLNKQKVYYANLLEKEIKEFGFPVAGVVIGGLLCLLGIWLFTIHIVAGSIGLGIGGVLIWQQVNKLNKERKRISENVTERHKRSEAVLRGCIAESVDYRLDHKNEDLKAEKVRELLNSIIPEDFSSVSKETPRNIL